MHYNEDELIFKMQDCVTILKSIMIIYYINKLKQNYNYSIKQVKF